MKFFLAALLLFLLMQISPLTSYFSQDDFYHLRQVSGKSIIDLPTLLTPGFSDEQTFYRPIGREIFNFFAINIFGVNPLPYHLVNLFLIILNGFLLIKVASFFSKDKLLPRFAFLIYIFSAVHSIELYYLSSIQTLISTTFILLGIANFSLNRFSLSFILFFLALLSHESAAVYIFILALIEIFKLQKKREIIVNHVLKRLLVFAIPIVIVVYIHLAGAGISEAQVYKPVFSPMSILNNLVWFTLWSFGLPEMLTDFMTLKLRINPNLIKFYGDYVRIISILLLIAISSLAFLVFQQRELIRKEKTLLLFISLYIVSLLPFLFFPQHKFVYYLTLPVIWFSLAFGVILSYTWRKKNKFIVLLILSCFVGISYKTLEINKITHWAAKRAKAAEVLLADFKRRYPSIEKGSIFYLKKDEDYPKIAEEWGSSSKQAFYILSGSDALQLFYKDPSIKVYYEDIHSFPKEKNVVIYTPKFPY